MRDLETDPAAAEAQHLRRSLRDVVALSMLPSVWAGYEPRQICEDVVDVVARLLAADGVCLGARVDGPAAIVRLARPDDAASDRALRRAVKGTAGEAGGVLTPEGTDLRILTCGLSFDSTERLLVASRRPDFPTESEKLLVRIAANQASTWLEWKRAQSALADESAFREAIEESMLAGVAAVDETGRQTYVNAAFARMVGCSEEELIGATPPFAYWAPEDTSNIMASFREVISGGPRPSGYELVFRRRSGERWNALVLISPLRSPDPAGYLACVYDITERKEAERSVEFLAEAGEMLGRSLDAEETVRAITSLAVPRIADWCFVDVVDGRGGFRRVATAHADPALAPLAARLRRSRGPQDAPRGIVQTFAERRTAAVNDVSLEFLAEVALDDDHLEVLRAMGIRCFVSVPMESRGRTFGVITFVGTESRTRFDARDVALAEDLARRAALAIDNARLYQEAQEANRAKDEFLANVSHEVRTPMTAILGWVHLLQLGGLESDQIRLGLATIRESAEAQAKLIDDLLDVSRIIAGKLQLAPKVVSLGEIVAAAVAAARPAAHAKRLALEFEAPANPLTVRADRDRLQQVFWNLLSNAVKFTPPCGTVRVRVDERGQDSIEVVVEDTGEGIAPEFLPVVFERFRQLPQSARGRSGLGLGLAIAKELVEMHGGTIEARSEGASKGSTFTIVLPRGHTAAPDPRDETESEQRARLGAVRVLVVEDDESIRSFLTTTLRRFGAVVSDASCGAEAEAMIDACDPHVLLTDIDTRDGDRISLLHRLRRGTRARFPAVAVTADTDPATRETIRAAGFDGFVTKPFDPAMLTTEILRVLSLPA